MLNEQIYLLESCLSFLMPLESSQNFWVSHSLAHAIIENMPMKDLLVEESNDLTSNVLPSCLLVVHDTSAGGQDDVTELTRWQQLYDPLLEVTELNIVAGRDNTGLVETAVELDNDLAVAVIIDLLEFTNVA
jgi:hypothetical protein